MTDRERRAEELQRRREALDRLKDDDDNGGGKPSEQWEPGNYQCVIC